MTANQKRHRAEAVAKTLEALGQNGDADGSARLEYSGGGAFAAHREHVGDDDHEEALSFETAAEFVEWLAGVI